MSNTLRETGGQGSGRIVDAVPVSGLDVDMVEILEDDTDFDTVQMQTKDSNGLWGVDVQIAGTTTEPHFGTGHVKGEFISMVYDNQRITHIKLGAGSIRYYNRV
jgi:hypothetical protein